MRAQRSSIRRPVGGSVSRGARLVAVAAVVSLLCTGCLPQILIQDAQAMDMVTVVGCSNLDPFDPEYLPDPNQPLDHPLMFATVEVTNDFDTQHQFSVKADIFTLDGEQVGGMSGYVDTVQPGETGQGLLVGDMQMEYVEGNIDCRLESVHVESSPYE